MLDRSDVLNAMDARGHDVVAPAFERFAAGDRERLARVTGWPVDGVVLTLPAGVDDRMGRLALAVLDGS